MYLKHRNFLYEEKFKRITRPVSINQMHDVWLRLKSRSNKIWKQKWDLIDEIYEKIFPNEKGQRFVYHKIKDQQVCGNLIWKEGNPSSARTSNCDKPIDKQIERDITISKITGIDSLSYKLGKELRQLDLLVFNNQFKWRVKEELDSMISNKIRESFPKLDHYYDENREKIIQINGHKYIFEMGKGIKKEIFDKDIFVIEEDKINI